MNTKFLFYGDNLDVLKRHIADDSVDLVYLDPPFNSNQDYNVLFAEQDGNRSAAQIKAFGDTWRWDQGAAGAYEEIVEKGGRVGDCMRAFRTFLGDNDMMAYIAMMAPRLVELRRVMKETASIYLHCDPTAGHYLKMLMDSIFGPQNFRSEIVWKRSSAHSDTKQGRKQYGRIHDVILFYTKSDSWTWNPLHTPYDEEYIDQFYRHVEEETGRRYRLGDLTGPGGASKGNPIYEVMGVTRYWRYSEQHMRELTKAGRVIQTKPGAVPAYKRYLDEMPGVSLQDVWVDIKPIGAQAAERLRYPTQKPESLLERIIRVSSNEGDTVLDPFCGCGTAIAAAERLNRKWIGIDITHLAVGLIKHRLYDSFERLEKRDYEVKGEPTVLSEAKILAQEDPFQFQCWALGLVNARQADPKKGADRGIDGRLCFHDELRGKSKQIIFSVKAGQHLSLSHVRDLRGVIEREKSEIGVLICMEEPTRLMRAEAAAAGFYVSRYGHHPRLQILTVEQLLDGIRIDYPPQSARIDLTFKRTSMKKARGQQIELPLDSRANRSKNRRAR